MIALYPKYIFIISKKDGSSLIRVGDMQERGKALYCVLSKLFANQVLVIRALNEVVEQLITNNNDVILDFFISSMPFRGQWICNCRWFDSSVLLEATLSIMSPCRQLLTIFRDFLFFVFENIHMGKQIK